MAPGSIALLEYCGHEYLIVVYSSSGDEQDCCASQDRHFGGHSMIFPPAMSRVTPVIHDKADDARKRVAAATSSGCQILEQGLTDGIAQDLGGSFDGVRSRW
ncbi:MAG: hypothetical protein ABSA02_09895 [Trebonia sp.]